MNRTTRVAALAAALLSSAASAQAQDIQWKQTVNLPKGLNMPQGVSADILGIQMGDTYAEAKAKLQAIARQSKGGGNLTEKRVYVQLGTGSARVQVPVVRGLELNMLAGPTAVEGITVALSLPSSGHQVVGVSRSISYRGPQNEVRIDSLLQSLKAKFKAEPKQFQNTYAFQFDNGQATGSKSMFDCRPFVFTAPNLNTNTLPDINKAGDCDVSFHIEARPGQSAQHAANLVFQISDNERLKQNYLADFAFIQNYGQAVQKQREQMGGAPGPKL